LQPPPADRSNNNNENVRVTLWLGNFNRHHPHWDDPTDTRLFTRSAIHDAEILISIVADLGLNMVLPLGTPMHLHNVTKKWTRLDQVFISEEHMDSIISCKALLNNPGINTDHLLILTTLDLDLTRALSSPLKNFRNINWEEFNKALTKKLNKLGPPTHICTPGELEAVCSKLTEAIQDIINIKVPTSSVRIKAKKWWTKELKFRGRPGRTMSDTVHLLVHKIKDSWRKQQVTVVLFLDIEGAFPNAVTTKLLHSMRKRRLPEKLIRFAGIMLENQHTTLHFDDHTLAPILLDNGIRQGDPLSMALYQYYNTDILDLPNGPQESAEAYVDNAILTATAKTFKEAHSTLAEMMTRTGGMIEWSKSHNSSIEYSKLVLIDFSHHRVKKPRPPLTLPSITVEPSPNTKYLSIMLDQHLNWAPQLTQIRGKGTKWTSQICSLARPTWGLTPKGARKLYMSMALPQILYSIDIWCPPLHRKTDRGGNKGSVSFIKKLSSIQQAGALAITGGFRTSPSDSLDTHTALLPIDLRIEKTCHNTFTRMATLPCKHPLHKLIKRSAKRYVKRHQSPLHTLAGIFGIDPSKVETIPPVHIHPRRQGLRDIRTDILLNKEDSKRADTNTIKKIKVYSDRSAHNGRVGTAAILKQAGKLDHILKLHLGSTDQHTVYKVELVGMIMGLHLIKTEPRSKVKCSLSIDNQAALVAIKSEMNKLGQHLAANILQLWCMSLRHHHFGTGCVAHVKFIIFLICLANQLLLMSGAFSQDRFLLTSKLMEIANSGPPILAVHYK
jgi:hypothetical protein